MLWWKTFHLFEIFQDWIQDTRAEQKHKMSWTSCHDLYWGLVSFYLFKSLSIRHKHKNFKSILISISNPLLVGSLFDNSSYFHTFTSLSSLIRTRNLCLMGPHVYKHTSSQSWVWWGWQYGQDLGNIAHCIVVRRQGRHQKCSVMWSICFWKKPNLGVRFSSFLIHLGFLVMFVYKF